MMQWENEGLKSGELASISCHEGPDSTVGYISEFEFQDHMQSVVC